MFTRIVVATDLSDASDRVIGCLHGLKPIGVQEVVLIHALGIRYLDDLKYVLAPHVEDKLAAQRRMLEDQEFQVSVRVEPGLAALEINRIARETKASMIVMGSHGATLSREILLGSVTTEVLHQSHNPVFVEQLRICDTADGRARFDTLCADYGHHVLFATDFSDSAELAFGYVEKIAESAGRITLLHVQDRTRIEPQPHDRLEQFNRIDEERLECQRARLRELGAEDTRIRIRYGHPVEEIVEFADQGEVTLIVMGSQGRGRLASVMLGNVSLHVTRLASVPILLVPRTSPADAAFRLGDDA
jgi:nucleotide-binding universal stress UspA family protein